MGERVLGVEGGGTKTAWVLLDCERDDSRVLEQGKLPPSNLRLTAPERLRMMFEELPRNIDRGGIFLAGCVTDDDRRDLATLCAAVWPNAQIVTGSDRDSGLAAALEDRDGIAVNAGTGSSVTGRRAERIEKAGGWGHILGDTGGGYFLSVQALRLVLREHDVHRGEAEFAASILRALCLNNFDELVRWAQAADKMDVATLAPIVFEAAERGDAPVRELVRSGAAMLARYTCAVADRLQLDKPEVRLLGGLFHCCNIYRAAFIESVNDLVAGARIELAKHAPEFGAAWLAMRSRRPAREQIAREVESGLSAATTEQRNERSAFLDRLGTRELVDLFVNEEQFVQEALRACAEQLSAAVDLVARALRNGGHLYYIGAGTSGRLGVLDASEIPPTFGASPHVVQGIIAGGAPALHRSVEGAEDERAAGSLAIHERNARAGDVLCGISASGRTPFVLGGLDAAKQLGARTILLTCNPAAEHCASADLQINLPTGPEIVTGSTRLKAGTATKVALNIISTGAMIRLGKVRGNVMSHVMPANAKLRDRAARIVADLRKCSYDEAITRLEATNWDVPSALDGA
jgi:N-acetylmuramic acid 6-phosphate etherase